MSEVIRRQQMNPVVEVVEAMMERRRRQRNSFFSRVIQGESNEEEWRKKPVPLLVWRQEPRCGKTLIHNNKKEYEVERDICVK